MRNSKAAHRYASSLLELALEKGLLEAVKTDMDLVKATAAESHELDLLLHSPIVKPGKKQAILKGIFEKSVDNLTMQFLNILASKGREDILVQICDAFSEAYRQHKGIVNVEVTSARALTATERKEIEDRCKASGIAQIELTETVDESLLGGLRIRMGDRLMDATLAKKLNDLQKQLS